MTCLRLFALACVLSLLATAPRAQLASVSFTPPIPLAGQAAEARVVFVEARPTSVSLFVRPVGSRDYQEIVGIDRSSGTWAAELPFDVPAQGLEVYAEYVLDGETRSEPQRNPDTAPFRVPALSTSAVSGLTLPARQYRMVSVPFLLEAPDGVPVSLGSSEPLDIFGDDFGADGDPSQWRVLRWNPNRRQYADAVVDRSDLETRVRPGRGFWIVTSSGGPFDVERALSPGVTFDGEQAFAAPVSVDLDPGWNQIGTPYLVPIAWADVENAALVEDPVGFDGTYTVAETTLMPWEGYFVFNPTRRRIALRFNASPPPDDTFTPLNLRSIAERMRARAGGDAAVLSVTAHAGTRSDAVYLGLAEDASSNARPLDLHKPPAVDDGVRLTVRDDGEDWTGRFHSREKAQWTLELTTPTGEATTLQLDAEGAWPDIVITDLDRDIELTMHGDRVVVPALASSTTRRLQVRIGGSVSRAPDVDIGSPWPNPGADLVTIPYTLAEPGSVRVDVLDALGRTVRTLHDGDQDAGPHSVLWDGHDASGQPAAAGVYLVRLNANGRTATTRLTRLR